MALPPGRGSSLGSSLRGLCSAAERRAAAPAARLGPWEHGWVQHASGDPPFLWGLPLVLPLNGKALLGMLWRGCSSLSRWPQCLVAEARGQKHPASGGPLFPLGAPLKLDFCVAFSRTLCPGAGGAAGSGCARHFLRGLLRARAPHFGASRTFPMFSRPLRNQSILLMSTLSV